MFNLLNEALGEEKAFKLQMETYGRRQKAQQETRPLGNSFIRGHLPFFCTVSDPAEGWGCKLERNKQLKCFFGLLQSKIYCLEQLLASSLPHLPTHNAAWLGLPKTASLKLH